MFLPSNITLQFGDSGDFVSELQRRLATINSHSADAISGMYDGITVNSVSAFQARSGLRADGIAGPETLRKLNGVISGDTSSSDKKEEEAAPQYTQAQMARDEFMAIQPAPIEPIQERRNLEERRPDFTPDMSRAEPPVQYPAAPTNEQTQQALAREQQQQHVAQSHDLAAMLMPQARPEMREEPRPEQHTRPAGVQVLSTHQAPAHQAAPQHTAEQHPAAPEAAKQTAPAQQEPKGIVGRVMEKLDAFAQKMAAYFEAKLSPDVLHEVKQAGQIMLQSGVKEAVIPTGPEQVRSQALPARGPEQQAPQMPQRH